MCARHMNLLIEIVTNEYIASPVEITAAQILLTLWDNNKAHAVGYNIVICFCVCIINVLGVRYFGESEFFFSIIKRRCSSQLSIRLKAQQCERSDAHHGPHHRRSGHRPWWYVLLATP